MYKSLEEIIKLANSQIGYKETGNNHTKYSQYFDNNDGAWQWFNTKKQGSEWCAIFICWLFTQVIGNKPALSFLGCPAPKNNCAAGCGYLYDYMKSKGYKSTINNCKVGDIVFFKNGSKCSHVGICVEANEKSIYTVEGNKDNQVKKVQHNRTSNIYFGVMAPDYSKAIWVGESNTKPKDDREQLYINLAHKCIQGFYGNGLIRKKKLNSLGYGDIYTKVQNYVNLILAGKVK